ncbi:MAG: hypothetical protein AAFR75_04380 [Pseudomonadota bacterium]
MRENYAREFCLSFFFYSFEVSTFLPKQKTDIETLSKCDWYAGFEINSVLSLIAQDGSSDLFGLLGR